MNDICVQQTGNQTFQELIESAAVYVDKTSYLAKLIESGHTTWLFTRPKGFGKSLYISTFESIFSGHKELFSGLTIENIIGGKCFAPRPVLKLDMSDVDTTGGPDGFYNSLLNITGILGNRFNIDVSEDLTAKGTLSSLIYECHRNLGTEVAVLIDNYDAPVTGLLGNPEEAQKVRNALAGYFETLKSNDRHISFVFLAGITQMSMSGMYSGFNNYIDISRSDDFGALAGFTEEEILRYFGPALKRGASNLNMKEEELVSKLHEYCHGFCFDGETFVYSPADIFRFFKEHIGDFSHESVTRENQEQLSN
jgi:hypothetical protein